MFLIQEMKLFKINIVLADSQKMSDGLWWYIDSTTQSKVICDSQFIEFITNNVDEIHKVKPPQYKEKNIKMLM